MTPTWYDARGWHGSTKSGSARAGFTCDDWTSKSASRQGANGELDFPFHAWLGSYTNSCAEYMAVMCAQVAP